MADHDARIARVERGLDLVALAAGAALVALGPTRSVPVLTPTLLLGAGLALLGTGLGRDLAWLALAGRPAMARREGPPELRLCLESTLGVLAVVTGLVWRWAAPGAARPVDLGWLVVGAAAVATFGQLTRNVIVALRLDPGHRSLPFRS